MPKKFIAAANPQKFWALKLSLVYLSIQVAISCIKVYTAIHKLMPVVSTHLYLGLLSLAHLSLFHHAHHGMLSSPSAAFLHIAIGNMHYEMYSQPIIHVTV